MPLLRVSVVFASVSCAVVGALMKLGAFVYSGSATTLFVMMGLVAFGAAWCAMDIISGRLKAIIIAGVLAEVLGVVWLSNLRGHDLPTLPPVLAIALSAGFGHFYSASGTGKRRKKALALFGDRLSPKQLARIVDSNAPLEFAGELRESTVLVCEIINQARVLDQMAPQEHVAMCNFFMGKAAAFLRDRGAYLEDQSGQSLRAVFGVLDEMEHAAMGCAAALDLTRHLDESNQECAERWHHMFDFRLALNSGEIMMAAYGEGGAWGLRTSGDTVEFARRLCLANNVFGTRLLIGGETQALAAHYIEVRPIEMIRGGPERAREEVYELLAKRHELSDEQLERRDLFWKAIVCYRQQAYEEALGLLFAALPEGAQDPAAMFYIRRIEHLRRGGQVHELENARL